MDTYRELILQYSSRNKSFGLTDLWGWLSSKGMTVRNTMNCMLSKMVEEGDIVRIARGRYAAWEDKNTFGVELTKSEVRMAKMLMARFPFAPVCVYNGSVFSPLQHHLSDNRMTYIETDRSAVEAFFDCIREKTERVWLMPDADMLHKYVDLSKGGIIVKPLVTEAPLQETDGVKTPTLEKLLVDIRKDADFSYLQGTEADRMWEYANTLFNINLTRLKRYAKRRGLKLEYDT